LAPSGFGFSLTKTPIDRIINCSGYQADRGGVFAAEFALSHACWLMTFPLAGWIGAGAVFNVASRPNSVIGAACPAAVQRLLPAVDPYA